MKLMDDTVLSSKKLVDGTVPSIKRIVDGTVSTGFLAILFLPIIFNF